MEKKEKIVIDLTNSSEDNEILDLVSEISNDPAKYQNKKRVREIDDFDSIQILKVEKNNDQLEQTRSMMREKWRNGSMRPSFKSIKESKDSRQQINDARSKMKNKWYKRYFFLQYLSFFKTGKTKEKLRFIN